MEIIIRQETGADFDSVYKVVEAAFLNAAHTNHDEQNLVVRLRNSTVFVPELSLVAVVDGKIVGHIMFTKIVIKAGKETFTSLMLAPVSVLPEMQGKNIGEKLILAGHKIAQALGFTSVILVGHPGYYPRFGYIRASNFGITLPIEVPDEAFMAYQLTDNSLSKVEGVVEFPKEFLI
ncbi:N-acetyltransferase [Pelosinus sp. IPA-1]|uniref:GNAT family N-acetyltransferase n=1 Tax=Pelosinus sp. IPA-1 TaxID=3029569 RepID=UPI002553E5E5|nr:N-acetyltransferase [Pelosinus sp. IPA-1]